MNTESPLPAAGFDLASLRGRFAYQPLLLGAVALLTSGILAWVAQATRPAIEAAEARDLANSLAQVLPAGFADNDLLRDTVTVDEARWPVIIHRASKDGVFQGAIFRWIGRGYAGNIVVLMAVDRDGRLLGVRVIKHSETPGLGDKIEVGKGDWIHAFAGKSLSDPVPEKWAVKKDGGVFDQFAGATITPRAVVKAVKEGLQFFAAHRAQIAGQTAGEATSPEAAPASAPSASAEKVEAPASGPSAQSSSQENRPARRNGMAASPVREVERKRGGGPLRTDGIDVPKVEDTKIFTGKPRGPK